MFGALWAACDDDTTERMTHDHHRRVDFVDRAAGRCGVAND
jgi:hypothetical protein